MRLLIILLSSVLFSISFAKSLNICVASRVGASIPAYKTAIENAIKLSAEDNHVDTKIRTFFYSNPLDPIRVYDKMNDGNCDAIIGYEYLTDILLLDRLRNINVPIFSLYGSNYTNKSKIYDVFFLLPSYLYQSNQMISFMKKNLCLECDSNVLILTNTSSESMRKYSEAYSKMLKKEKIDFKNIDFSDESFDILQRTKTELKKKHYKFIIILSSSSEASYIINGIKSDQYIYI